MADEGVKGKQPDIEQVENSRPLIDARLIAATLIFAAGLAAGFVSASLSLVGLALFGAIDLVRSLVRAFSLSQSSAPSSGKVYFGFSRWPAVCGLAAGILVILSGGLMFSVAGGILKEELPAGSYYPAIAIIAISLAAAGFISTRKRSGGGFSLHFSRIWTLLSLVVLAELLIVQFLRFQSLDPVIAIFIALFVLGKSVRLVLESVRALLDNRLPQYEEEWIGGLVREYAGPHFRLHDLEARKRGNSRWIDFHLAVAENIPVDEAFDLAGELEKKLIEKIPGAVVIIHVDFAG
jgi:ferrous-iron efflux pump FieF